MAKDMKLEDLCKKSGTTV